MRVESTKVQTNTNLRRRIKINSATMPMAPTIEMPVMMSDQRYKPSSSCAIKQTMGCQFQNPDQTPRSNPTMFGKPTLKKSAESNEKRGNVLHDKYLNPLNEEPNLSRHSRCRQEDRRVAGRIGSWKSAHFPSSFPEQLSRRSIKQKNQSGISQNKLTS